MQFTPLHTEFTHKTSCQIFHNAVHLFAFHMMIFGSCSGKISWWLSDERRLVSVGPLWGQLGGSLLWGKRTVS